MLSLRLKALDELRNHKPVHNPEWEKKKVSDIYGEDVFGDSQLKSKLHTSSYNSFKNSLETGAPLDPKVADEIASAMKDWALSKGATHFTHWFQPLTGLTAEKHDSFLGFSGSVYSRELKNVFTGKQLIKGEPDASSFPHGGIRSTFEARGYTCWDMESPSFIRSGPNGAFLCVPTAFASWTGDSLDTKTPLLRSGEAVSKAVLKLAKFLGMEGVTGGYGNLGIEQEFFLIDRGFYLARPDLMACNRTVIGAPPPKGQEMEDHYFGSLDKRVLGYIQDVEWTLWKLGVPTTTRHYEVAPSQYEMAPIFETIGVACDHNMVQMEVMKEIARKHNFACLFHEKPFAGVNGSGKHNNWSISTNTGENLMEPGHNPKKNAQFMIVLAAVVRMVHLYGDLMRVSISQHGNDFRLGANEAPPAIMSIYLGDQLDKIIQEIVKSDESLPKLARVSSSILLGTNSLPSLPRDQSDRNRTSPFAFTGNKFEFRAVGSSQACARPNVVLNTIFSDSLEFMIDELEKEVAMGIAKNTAVLDVVTRVLKEHHKCVFNGNGYSQEWVVEAKERGLPNLRTGPEAIATYTAEKNLSLFEKMKVLSRREIISQQNILYETFSKTVNIEAETLVHMVSGYIIPACLEYKQRLIATCDSKDALLTTYNTNLSDLVKANEELKQAITVAINMEHHPKTDSPLHEQAAYYRKEVMDIMQKAREFCDNLEVVTDDKLWPFPKYSEILFMK